jgi:hypothetical protein
MAGTLNSPAPTGPMKANGFYSFVVTIPDDDFYSFSFKGTCGHIFIATNSSSHQGMFWFRGTAQSKYSGAATTVGVNTSLNGTTGSDGNTTFGTASSVLYIENRSGGALEYVVTMLTENADHE